MSPIQLEFNAENAVEKSLVRLAQASRPVPESYLAARAGALVFQVAGVATMLAGLFGGVALARSRLDDALGFPAEYLSVALAVVSALSALLLLVVGDLLILQVAVARNTRLASVLLAEMNFADRAEHDRRRRAEHPTASSIRTRRPFRWSRSAVDHGLGPTRSKANVPESPAKPVSTPLPNFWAAWGLDVPGEAAAGRARRFVH